MKRTQGRKVMFVPLVCLMLAALACGGFQVRVTPTPKAVIASPTVGTPLPTAAPTVTAVRVEATKAPAPTATSAPLLKGLLKVTATGGVNAREQPSAKARQVGRFNVNTIVTVLEGPTTADGYSWWKVSADTLSGWVASGPANDPWLVAYTAAAPVATPSAAPRLVSRAIKLGDRVQVTTAVGQALTVRDSAGKDATMVARVVRGTLFTVRSGPVKQDGFTWWELEGEKVKGWAAEGDTQDRWLTPVE